MKFQMLMSQKKQVLKKISEKEVKNQMITLFLKNQKRHQNQHHQWRMNNNYFFDFILKLVLLTML